VIRQLTIRDLALVDRLDLEFGPGLNLLTGETGSGKSIIIDALGLALGERASPDQVRAGRESGLVEAAFEVDGETEARIRELGHSTDEGMVRLTRELSRAGRGTCRIDGRTVAAQDLRRVGDLLVDIHGQREHQSLLQEDRLLAALDRFGGAATTDLADGVAGAHRRWAQARAEVAWLSADDAATRREADLLRFEVDEIEAAAPAAGEDQALAAERTALLHAGRLREAAAALLAALHGEDRGDRPGAVAELRAAEAGLEAAEQWDQRLAALRERLRPLGAELEELAHDARAYLDGVADDPRRLAEVEERLELLTRLVHKHGGSLEAVLEHAAGARARLAEVEDRGERLRRAGAEEAAAALELAGLASKLSQARAAAAAELCRKVEAELADLKMERASLTLELAVREDADGLEVGGRRLACSAQGVDSPSLWLTANPGEPPLPLQRVASGGEVSRVMLALRGVLSDDDRIATIILDEIDVGIGGATAARLGRKLSAIARRRQVICVTHLAAVAAMADHHLTVRKRLVEGRHVVEVERLSSEARVPELARLLAGDVGGEAALATARDLLAGAAR
jgi:DNA repair protein RecN (Recombination protein N)